MEFINKVRHHINLYRRVPYWSRQNVIFVHVPKAAGTSINKAIYGRTLGHFSAFEIKAKFPRLYARSFVFSIVRNPWDRVLSAYRFAVAGGTDVMAIAKPDRYKIDEFANFERFLFEWLARRDLMTLDYVFQPQSHFLCGAAGNILVDYIGKVERLSADIKPVEERLHRSLDLSLSNRTSKGVPYSEFYWNKDMIDIVGKKYRNDIDLLGYSFGS